MNEIDNSQILIGKHIYEASKNNDLVVFVGAGVSANSGVPNWEQLIKQLKNDLPESMNNEQDYLKVAELYRTVSASEDDYLKSISKHLRCNETHFNPIHKAILRLNPSHIITTNFDNLLEEACADSKVHYSVIRTDKQVPQAMYSRYLIKMHGDFESGKIVLTETDYYNYASEFPLIDVLVKSLFASKTVLFVGFSFNDLNLKVILNKVQSVLGKDAKPIYLLEDFEREPLLIKYLKKKGVNPFWLPQEIVDKFGDDAPEELIINKGREVYRQLSCLKNDVSKSVDILHELHSYAESVENYMPFFYVSRLNKIVSDMTCRWSITGRGIQLESDSLNNIVEQCKTRSGLRRFLELRGEEYHSLIRTAVNNRILSFGEIQLLKIKEFRRCWENSDKIDEGCSMFLDFDFRALKKRIKELEGREITYSHRDLELPFIKWMLGDIISAFDLYESLEKHYWDNNKAFLYFICVFNKASIFKGTVTISDRDSLDKIEHMEEVVKGIDMLSVLSGLTIDARIKANLLDLINNQYYIDAFSHVNQLMNCILEARSRSERGGYTRNSNIESLSWEICRSFDYSLLNYLITTNSLSAYETYRNGIIGLLNAHFIRGTRANNGFISSRLDAIGAGHIKLMLFAIKADDLIRVFDFYSIKSLLLDSSACEYLQRVIDNVSRDHNTIKCLFKENLLVDKLKSIIFIYWKASNRLDRTSKIINILILYNLFLHPVYGKSFKDYAYRIIKEKGYTLSEKQCRQIISFFPELEDIEPFPSSLICLVSYRMKNRGWLVDYHNDYRGRIPKLSDIYIFYDIVSEDVKIEFNRVLREEIDPKKLNSYDKIVLSLLVANKPLADFVSPSMIDCLGDTSWATNNDSIRCRALMAVYKQSTNKKVRDRIRVIRRFDKHLDFLLSPIRFKGEIEVSWLKEVDDTCFGVLVKRKNIVEAIKQPDADPSVVARFLKC